MTITSDQLTHEHILALRTMVSLDWRWEPSAGIFGSGPCRWALYSTDGDVLLAVLHRSAKYPWSFAYAEAFGSLARHLMLRPTDDGYAAWTVPQQKAFVEHQVLEHAGFAHALASIVWFHEVSL